MKYTVEHACGHQAQHGLFGAQRDRDSKLEWLKTTLCSDCYQEEQERQRAEADAKAAAENQKKGLPALTGSEKQIAWAESIRAETLERCAALVEIRYTTEATDEIHAKGAALQERLAQDLSNLGQQSRASWWIDNRDRIARDFETRRHELTLQTFAAEIAAQKAAQGRKD